MRLRPTIWIVTCLLLMAGAWLLWRAHNHRTIAKTISRPDVVATVHSTSTAPNLLKSETTVAANVAENVTATVKTNPFAYRLSNTGKTIGQLSSDRHAILLENALIDTGSPLNLPIPPHLRTSGDTGAYIVQSRAPANAAFHNLLQQTGARIVSYIPNDAYLISASAAVANLLRAQSPVQAVIPYEPYYKFQTSLIGLAAENLPLPDGTLLNLGLFSDNVAQTTSQIEKMGGQVLAQEKSPFGPVLIVKPPQNWTTLATISSVGIVEPFRQRVHANDLSRAVNGVAADTQTISNYMGLTGSNVIVAVDDSGVDTNHPDFLTAGAGTPLRILMNNPAVDGVDFDGHGTHVAGIIAGDGTESMTVSNAEGSIMPATNGQFRGMAPLAQILSLSFGNNFFEGTEITHDIGVSGSRARDADFQGIAALTNALISNNSWNYNGDSEYDLAAASYDAATRDALPAITGSQPVLFVFSAGNQGGGNNEGSGGFADTVLSPATAKNVITVGAVEELRFITNIVTDANSNQSAVWQPETDTSFQTAAFSSRGNVGIGFEGQAGRFKPDVVAPGTFVVSTRSSEWLTNVYYNPTNDNITGITDLLETNSQTDPPFPFFAFPNAIGITITASSPATNNLLIYLWEGTDPHTVPPDMIGTNSITINPPYNPPPLNEIWQCAVTNTTSGDLPYSLTVDVQTTNDLGNYYQVLQGMNDSIGGNDPAFPMFMNGFYRYETGTSMSAASVSGTLALMADYFTNQLQLTPSPALLKAMLINGARPSSDSYNYQIQNSINYEGWGQINLPNSIQQGLTNQFDRACETFFQDQSPTNALATGDTHTYYVTLDTANTDVQFADFQFTLAWTDPPGNPVAAVKLVNNLDLVVSNMDTGETYFGNDIPAGSIYNNVWDTNSLALATNAASISDTINNVEQVILPGRGDLATHYAVMVVGKSVDVNAVYAQSNNIVQDYALVMSSGIGETNVFTVTDGGISNNATAYQDITVVTVTNTPLFNQFVGASSPLLGTNQINLGANLLYGTNGLITLGQTNQWHFYIVTNTGAGADFTNAAFITFLPDTLALPRTGVYADSEGDSTRSEADIDLYVSTDSNIMNLDPVVIANADKSLGRGGTEFVTYTNSVSTTANPNNPSVYYIGVKSEDQMASEYAFIPIFTDIPFGSSNSNGDQVINGLNVPVPIPDGSPSHPGVGYVFAIGLQQEDIKRVIVTNIVQHQNFGDLVGVLSHADQKGGNIGVTLNSHDEPAFPPPPGPYTNVYDDSGQNDIPGAHTTDGPGSLNNFVGGEALGVWILSEIDNSQTQTGSVQNVSIFVEKHQDPTKGITVTIQPGAWFYTFVDVPAGITNLQLFGTNLSPAYVIGDVGMYLRFNAQPDLNFFDFEADLTNASAPGTFGGNEISDGPPLTIGRYFIGLFNSDTVAHTVYLLAQLNGSLENIPLADWTTNNTALLDDAVASSTIHVPATNLIAEVNVGFVVEHPRISDLSFTLISPTGQRILLMEDRGGPTTQNAGHLNVLTNYFGVTTAGNATASTNVVGPIPTSGRLLIDYDFFTVPDTIDVYYDGVRVGPGVAGTPISGAGTFDITYGPGSSTNIMIVMNAGNNTNTTTEWTYTPRVVFYDYNYLTFTEDTNLTQTPIKYAIPPFDLTDEGTNFILSDFEQAPNGDYFGPTSIFDSQGGWTVPTNILFSTNLFTNEVSVVTDPHDSFVGGNTNLNGTNFLALANGYIIRTNSLTLQRTYSISYLYRGPGISGWWRGEGDALDSSDPERLGQNGSLIGRFDFPAGEVGQAFEFEDAGANFEFAGTNTYVQIRQQPTYVLTVTNEADPPVLLQTTPLDVGAGGGLTVEGWINPTNIAHQEPLVEWLARVPTNGSDTNLTIIAGPFLDRDTDHYYYMLGPTNWKTSEIWAEQLGGHLATVDSANKENWIFDSFGNYGFTNHNLWIGLTNSFDGTTYTFGWADGNTNTVYTNWVTGQPLNCDETRDYTFITGLTNSQPGLWMLANSDGLACDGITYTNLYGVVEVPDIQTNGVQLWISVTNIPGTTNDIVDSLGNLYSNGCIYANLVDITDSNHIFFSQPLLIQTNIYQHIALTYDTNSGIANLFYNGTNVATTNLGVFQPKTTGDVLLGKDMSRETNNFYGGTMDEMSIYNRALSDAEILAIYNDSAQTNNRNIGKFDPAQSPPESLAEARVSLGDHTNVIFGNNTWQTGGFTFTAFTNSLVMQVLGLEPGMLLDNFTVTETPIGNLYYLPEQSLDELKSTSPQGDWTLEIWDNRTGAVAANNLVSWQLEFILASNPPPVVLQPEEPANITVPPNGFAYLTISVPDWASFATNILVSATGPVDMWFNPTNQPTGSGAGDVELLTNLTSGIGSPVLSATSNPPLPTNSFYYLGLRNNSPHAVSAVVEVDFDITTLSNGVPYIEALNTNQSGRYFAFDVSSNAYEATFQLLRVSNNVDLVVRKGFPLPTLTSDDYGSFNVSNADENIFVLTNSSPVPLSEGRWYLGAFKRTAGIPANFTVLAKELTNSLSTAVSIITLTNGVPFNFTAGPGAALTNFFLFQPTNRIVATTNGLATNFVQAIRFELYHLSGNGDLTVQTDAPPFAPPFFESSQNPGMQPELIMIRTNNALTNLVTQWYLGVPNREMSEISYTIIAAVETNGYFPAFPGAEGAGGLAIGGRNGDVYHVTSTDDSGPSTLRDAVTASKRTVVFDVSGTIFLQSPLVITNSFLTIAGQTAPGDGITVAGNMTVVTNAHDVVMRDVRFRSGGVVGGLFSSGFEQSVATDYANGQTVASWTVVTNQVSVVADSVNANQGSNFLALANGTISNSLATVPGQTYQLSFAYRGPGIISWWRGESNANDSMGVASGVLTNGTAYTNGEVSTAFNLPGVDPNQTTYHTSFCTSLPGPEVVVPTNSFWNFGTNNFTIELWANFNVTPSNLGFGIGYPFDGMLISDDAGTCGNNKWWFAVDGSVLDFHINDPSSFGADFTVQRPFAPQVHKWYHFAIARLGSTYKIYTNGVIDGSPITDSHAIPLPNVPLQIGGGEGFYFNGALDEVSIYRRALSASEIEAIYQVNTNGKFDSIEFSNSPSLSLAKAYFTIPGVSTNTIWGSNTNWQTATITFTATTNVTPLFFAGASPGVLLDALNTVPNDSLRLTVVSNVIADHISATWSTNEDVSVLSSTNVTVQWSVISDSWNDTNQLHGYGSTLRYGSGALTFHHNLYADNYSANPLISDNLGLDFVNNVIYNWGTNASLSLSDTNNSGTFTNEVNYICNYLIVGTNFTKVGTSLTNIAFWGGTTNTWIFETNNFIDSNTNGILDGADTGRGMFTNNYTLFDRPFPTVLPAIDEAFLAYEKVLDFAGPDMDKRDLADSNIVSNVRTQTGRILNSAGTLPSLNSIYPYLDTDQDGIPDFWELTFGEQRFTPGPTQDRDGDGYTDLEEYNNWLAGPHALTITNTSVGVDLQQLFGKTGNLSFSVTNAVQGYVYLTNVLNYTNVAGTVFAITNTSTFSNLYAIFTPTNNYSGYASFDVYATNNNTIAHFGPTTVSVVVSTLPVKIDSNMPPVIITLTNGQFIDPTNSGGSQYYEYTASPYAAAVLFQVTSISVPGGLDSVVRYQQMPSLSHYDYINTNSAGGTEDILVTTNSTPQPMTNGDWYLGVVNVNPTGDPVSYDVTITEFANVYPPVFTSPANGAVTNVIETTPFTLQCQASDTNSPPLPLTYSIVTNVWSTNLLNVLDTNLMTIDSNTGVISWTPDEAQGPYTNSVVIRVSNGYSSVTNEFTIIVLESNLPPFWTTNVVTNYVVNAQSLLSMVDTATDTDIPVNPLGYTLLDPPAGASIDTNGVITWMPTAAQEGSYVLTNIVTDTNIWAVNAQSLSNTNYIFITVLSPLSATNGLALTNIVGGGGIDWITVNVPTNADWVTNTLLFATNLPVNVWFSTNFPPTITNVDDIDLMPGATNGISVLGTNSIPTNIVAGGTYYLGVQNTNGVAVNYALEVDFHLISTIVPTNVIVISSITHTNIGGTNGFLLIWFAQTNDLFQVQEAGDLTPPIAWNTFSNVISYASLTPTNGIGLFEFFDDGSQFPFGPTRFYRLLLLQATNSLTLPDQTNYIAYVSQPLAVTNIAIDSNTNLTFTYSLTEFPTPSTLPGITNGIITWTPGASDAGSAFKFMTTVMDNGLPPVTATNAFTVFVLPPPTFSSVISTGTNVMLLWSAPTNDLFQIEWTTNLTPVIVWTPFPQIFTSTSGTFMFTDTNVLLTTKFYRLVWLPLP